MATDALTSSASDTATITLTVPADLARRYNAAPTARRAAWQVALELRLRFMVDPPTRRLEEIMDDLGRQAAANGLTEEILQDILREWDEERKAASAAGLNGAAGRRK